MTHGGGTLSSAGPHLVCPPEQGRAFMSLWDSEWTGDPWPMQRMLGKGRGPGLSQETRLLVPESVF